MATLLRVHCIASVVFLLLLLACSIAVITQARVDIEREIAASTGLVLALHSHCVNQHLDNCAPGSELITEFSNYRHIKIAQSASRAKPSQKGAPEWFANLVWPDDNNAKTVNLASGMVMRSDPTDEIAEVWEGIVQLFWLILACAAVANVAVFFAVSSSIKPIRRFLCALDQIEAGNYRERLPGYTIAEANRLALHFNRMAVALESEQRENRVLNKQLINLQEQERCDLARELHDDLGQDLAAIKAIAGTLVLSPVAEDSVTAHARKIIGISSTVLASFRRIIHRLRPAVLDRANFYEAARQLCFEWQDSVGIECQYRCADNLAELSASVSIHLYRILQEALNNALKHAAASRIEVDVSSTIVAGSPVLSLVIKDNGVGIADGNSDGMGLRFMAERARLIGATLKISKRATQGCRIAVDLPLKSQ